MEHVEVIEILSGRKNANGTFIVDKIVATVANGEVIFVNEGYMTESTSKYKEEIDHLYLKQRH